jgi:hypothetical protein
MDFLSIDNIRTILGYIKTDLKSKHINLNEDLKYEKIIKKLCKSILENNQHSSLDELNRIALEKIIPFITKTIIKTSPKKEPNSVEKLQTKLIIDTGTNQNSHVVNKSNNYWEKFALTLPNAISITEPTDIFLTSICICNPAHPNNKCLYFTIHIEEFKQITYSNNSGLYNKIVIPNTTNLDNTSPFILNTDGYYISTLNSTKLNVLNIEVGNQDNTNNIFKDNSPQNRIIMTFDLIPRMNR